MTHATYDSYKESGIPWLGKVPAGWEVRRLRNCAEIIPSNVDKKTIEGEIPVKLCNYVDVYYNDKITDEIKFMSATASQNEIARFTLKAGDVVITKDSESANDIGVPTLITDKVSNIVCGYHLAIIKGYKDTVYGAYLFYLIKSEPSARQFEVMSNGVTRFGLPYGAMKNLLISIPPLTEQKAIAEFLDNKTAQIDALIAKKKNLLKLLAEQRTALITNAVTRGLDKSAPMKESGITWLGKVPNHWEVVKITHGFNLVGSGTTPRSDNLDYYDGEIPWVTTSELRENVIYDTRKKLTEKAIADHASLPLYDEGALLIAMYGATIGRLGILGVRATVNQACCVFDKPKSFDTKFVFWWLQMAKPILISEATGGGQANLSQDTLKQLRVLCPKISEQKTIADFLDCKTAEIDATKDRITTAIDTLKEYRTALITNAVTGKIKVI